MHFLQNQLPISSEKAGNKVTSEASQEKRGRYCQNRKCNHFHQENFQTRSMRAI